MKPAVPQTPDIPWRWLGRVSYEAGLKEQERLIQRHFDAATDGQEDVIMALEHDPVITLGRSSKEVLPPGQSSFALPHFQTNRGGQATYHGPGQLVVYPILNLRRRGQDLHKYLRCLEQAIVETSRHYGVEAITKEGFTGVWVGDKKLASIGVGVRRWISMHGLAMNVQGDLSPFDGIIPCGLVGVQMTSLEKEGAIPVPSVQDSAVVLIDSLQQLLPKILS
ncbi:MAG: lipoyl(octanoyl) transferase LipB [Verrucomicrobiales bacterium]